MSIRNLLTDNTKSYLNIKVDTLDAASSTSGSRLKLNNGFYVIDDVQTQESITIPEFSFFLRINNTPQIPQNQSLSVEVLSDFVVPESDVFFLTPYTLNNSEARKIAVSIDNVSTNTFVITFRNNSNLVYNGSSLSVYCIRIGQK